MKRILLLCLLGLQTGLCGAQNEGSVFTATGRGGSVQTFVRDYHAIGINPANLGLLPSHKITFGFLEGGAGIGSRSLTRSQLLKLATSPDSDLMPADRVAFVEAFSKKDALNLNAEVTLLGFSIYGKWGGVALSNRQRVLSTISLNRNFADILFLGEDAPIYEDPAFTGDGDGGEGGSPPLLSSAFANSTLQISWLNEWNLAYGKQLIRQENLQLSLGLGYRYIQGIGVLDVQASENTFTAYNAMSAVFGVDYGNLPQNDPNFQYEPAKGNSPFYKPAGIGHGLDVGVSAKIGDKLRAGISVTDIGSITWKKNLLQAKDQPLQRVESQGIRTFNIFSEAATIIGQGMLTYQSGGEKRVALPTRLRGGLGYTVNEKLEAGLDVTVPLNSEAGNWPQSFAGLGVRYTPHSKIHLSTGVTSGAGYGTHIPFGLVLDFSAYELGLGTRSINGWLGSKNTYASAVVGMLRFKIGPLEEE